MVQRLHPQPIRLLTPAGCDSVTPNPSDYYPQPPGGAVTPNPSDYYPQPPGATETRHEPEIGRRPARTRPLAMGWYPPPPHTVVPVWSRDLTSVMSHPVPAELVWS
ncbi:unnamed protein product [Arctogadus glacialis]